MTDAPERIWATEDADNFGEDKFHTRHGPMKGLTEYTRADLCITRAECDRLIADAVDAEREACAKMTAAETGWIGEPHRSNMKFGPCIGANIAKAIRARKGGSK